MTWFADLSPYSYFLHPGEPRSVNVGWLAREYAFEQQVPSGSVLDALWNFCTISVRQTRGLHDCDLCGPEHRCFIAERHGRRIRLGSAEIAVISRSGTIYSAPDLIYHYVRTHNYRPPDGFLWSLLEAPRPPNRNYFARLEHEGLEWREKRDAPTEPVLSYGPGRVPEVVPIHLDN
jgi:hypothetical protein